MTDQKRPWWHWPANRHKTCAPWWNIARVLLVAPIYLGLTGLLILVVLAGWGVNEARQIKREML